MTRVEESSAARRERRRRRDARLRERVAMLERERLVLAERVLRLAHRPDSTRRIEEVAVSWAARILSKHPDRLEALTKREAGQ